VSHRTSSLLVIPYIAILSLAAEPIRAQPVVLSQLPQPPRAPQTQPLQLPPLLPKSQTPSLQLTPVPSIPSPGKNLLNNFKTIRVSRFRFIGNKVFSSKQLEQVTAPYVAQEVTPAELSAARAAVNQLYINAGYINSGAIFPLTGNQGREPKGTVVTIQVVEGTLEAINVTGSQHLKGYVQSRLKAATSPTFNYNQLLEELRLLQTDPLVKSISATVNQGSEQNKSILDVQLKAAQPVKVEVGANNYRSPATGSFERFVQFSDANLLGLGDRLGVTYLNTAGSNALAASYSVPFNARNGTVSLATSVQKNSIIEKPFSLLDINTDYRSYELSVRQPLIRRATTNSTQEFAVGLSAFHSDSQASLLGIPFSLSLGADKEGHTYLSGLRFFQEWKEQRSKQSLAFRSQFKIGLGIGSTVNPTPPDSRFLSWNGQADWVRQLPGNMRIEAIAKIQLADRALVPTEQFVLGGPGTIRGYRQESLLGDNGAFGSVELQVPIYSGEAGELRIGPFFDVGRVWNTTQAAPLGSLVPRILASVGMGLQYQLSDRLAAQLEWGIPLTGNLPGEQRSLQEHGILFSIQGRVH